MAKVTEFAAKDFLLFWSLGLFLKSFPKVFDWRSQVKELISLQDQEARNQGRWNNKHTLNERGCFCSWSLYNCSFSFAPLLFPLVLLPYLLDFVESAAKTTACCLCFEMLSMQYWTLNIAFVKCLYSASISVNYTYIEHASGLSGLALYLYKFIFNPLCTSFWNLYWYVCSGY